MTSAAGVGEKRERVRERDIGKMRRKRLFFEGVESAVADNREEEVNEEKAPNAFLMNLRNLFSTASLASSTSDFLNLIYLIICKKGFNQIA